MQWTVRNARSRLEEFYENLEELYKKHVVEFENTDDDYKAKAKEVYDACTDAGERKGDAIVKTAKFLHDIEEGADAAVRDFVSGILGLAAALLKIDLALRVAVVTVPFETTPQWVKDTGKEAVEGALGIVQILKNPGKALAAIGQKATDAVEEKGIPYALSYTVTDLAIGRLVDMGVGKLKSLAMGDELGDVARIADNLDDAADAMEVADDFRDAAKAVEGIDDLPDAVRTVEKLDDAVTLADGRKISIKGYSNFADGMSLEDAARYIAGNEKAFFNEFSERASTASLNSTQIDEAFEAMRNGDYSKIATYFDTSSPVDGAVFWSGNKEGTAAYANSIGGTIMEQTSGGQVFDNWRGLQGMYPEWGTGTVMDQKPIWEAMSAQYANEAIGTATYIHPEGYREDIWSNIEKQILVENDVIIEEVIINAK